MWVDVRCRWLSVYGFCGHLGDIYCILLVVDFVHQLVCHYVEHWCVFCKMIYMCLVEFCRVVVLKVNTIIYGFITKKMPCVFFLSSLGNMEVSLLGYTGFLGAFWITYQKLFCMYVATRTWLQDQKLIHSPLATETYISSTHLRSKSATGKS